MKFEGKVTAQAKGLVSFEIPVFDGSSWCKASEDPSIAAAEWLVAAVYGTIGIKIKVKGTMTSKNTFQLETSHIKEALGLLIQQQRRKKNLSIRELAKKIGLKSHTNIVHYEMAKSEPSFSKLEQILSALGYNLVFGMVKI